MQMITDSNGLKDACNRLTSADYITVDTEFLRDNTFWPKLCLVQVAGPDDILVVDPLVKGLDLSPLFDLMSNHDVLKVFHAARQDIEIFYFLSKQIPEPLFDTQVAAMVCGFGDSVGYETLVSNLAGAKVDKSSRFTNWSRRPLSDRQLTYAVGDVTHLRTVYEKLAAKLKQNDRMDWLDEEMANLMNPALYQMRPEEAWKRLKTKATNRRFLGVLSEVAAWREREAQARDVPRRRILKDEALSELAGHPPKNTKELERMRGIPKGFGSSKSAKSLLDAVTQGLDLPENQLPKVFKPKSKPKGMRPVVDLLKVLLKMKCEEEHVAEKLVYNNSDLERLAADDSADIPLLEGWRYELFGKDALALKHGQLAIAIKGRKIRLFSINDVPGNSSGEDETAP